MDGLLLNILPSASPEGLSGLGSNSSKGVKGDVELPFGTMLGSILGGGTGVSDAESITGKSSDSPQKSILNLLNLEGVEVLDPETDKLLSIIGSEVEGEESLLKVIPVDLIAGDEIGAILKKSLGDAASDEAVLSQIKSELILVGVEPDQALSLANIADASEINGDSLKQAVLRLQMGETELLVLVSLDDTIGEAQLLLDADGRAVLRGVQSLLDAVAVSADVEGDVIKTPEFSSKALIVVEDPEKFVAFLKGELDSENSGLSKTSTLNPAELVDNSTKTMSEAQSVQKIAEEKSNPESVKIDLMRMVQSDVNSRVVKSQVASTTDNQLLDKVLASDDGVEIPGVDSRAKNGGLNNGSDRQEFASANQDNASSQKSITTENKISSNSESSSDKPEKINIEKVVRESSNKLEEAFGRDSKSVADTDVKSNDSSAKFELPRTITKPQITDVRQEMTRTIPEPVKFKVELSNTGLKISDVSTFKVSLKPEWLGTVKVQLSMVDDQLSAKLSVESNSARHAVESNLPGLREVLSQHGIKVDSFSVDIADNGQEDRQFAQRENSSKNSDESSEEFSLDPDSYVEIPAEVRRGIPVGNLSGQLSMVA